MKHAKTILLVIFLSLTVLTLASCNFSYYQNWANSKDYTVGAGAFDLDSVLSISVDWINGDIEIVKADVEKVNVYEESNKELSEGEKLRHHLSDGILDIKYAEPRHKLIDFTLEKKLFIQVPASKVDKFLKLTINAVSADIKIKNIDANEFDIDTVSGKQTLDTLTVPICTIKSVSGSIDIITSKIANLDIESVSGTITVANSEITDLKVDATSGDIDITSTIMPNAIEMDTVSSSIQLTLPENDGFTLDYKSISGTFSCAFATTQNSGKYVYANGLNEIKIDTVSGNLSILKL